MHTRTIKLTIAAISILAASSLTVAYRCEQRLGAAAVQVVDDRGQPIMGASISSGGMKGITGNGGYLYSDGIPEGIHVVKAEFYGYAPSYHRVHVRQGASTLSVFHLLPIEHHRVRDLSAKNEIQSNGVRITIPAGSVDAREPGSIEVATILPERADLRVMPGEFGGLTRSRESVPLETLGALSLTVQNSQGKDVTLRKALTILVPYKGSAREKERIPLWSFEPKQGTWTEEGSGRIIKKGRDRYIEAQIPHLSWWNLDQPISTKTSIWVKSFVNEKDEQLFTPDLVGVGLDYGGISYPYGSYAKFSADPGPVLAGTCIDVKLGSKIRLASMFYGPRGAYEFQEEMQLPNRISSCRLDPQAGVVIEKIQMRRIPTGCVRGRAAFKEATSAPFDISVYLAPAPSTDPTESASPVPAETSRARDWSRPIARARTGSDGRFCLDHLPVHRPLTFSLFQRDPPRSSWNVIQPLMAQELDCRHAGRFATIERTTSQSEGFRCATDYEKCTDLGDIDGHLRELCSEG